MSQVYRFKKQIVNALQQPTADHDFVLEKFSNLILSIGGQQPTSLGGTLMDTSINAAGYLYVKINHHAGTPDPFSQDQQDDMDVVERTAMGL